MKTFWRDRFSKKWSFYCPLCAAERVLPFKPTPDVWETSARVFAATAFFTLVTYPWFGFKGVVSFVPLWMLYETIYRTRVRAKVACDHCGFDPFLYMQDVKKARSEIESHWRKKFAEKGIPYPEKGRRPIAANSPAKTDASREKDLPASDTQTS